MQAWVSRRDAIVVKCMMLPQPKGCHLPHNEESVFKNMLHDAPKQLKTNDTEHSPTHGPTSLYQYEARQRLLQRPIHYYIACGYMVD